MTITTYQAYTMAEALAAVKRDLGRDAVILETRSFKRGGVLGMGAQTIVEVSAMRGDEVATGAQTTATLNRARSRPQPAAVRAYAALATKKENTDGPDDDLLRLLQARSTMPVASAVKSVSPPPEQEQTPMPSASPPLSPPAPPTPPEIEAAPTPRVSPGKPRRFVLTPPDAGMQRSEDTIAKAKQPVRHETTVAMQDELSAIRTMVGQVLQRQAKTSDGNGSMPQQLFDLYLRLIGQDMSEELADEIVGEVRNALTTEELEDEEKIHAETLKRLAVHVPTADVAFPGAPADGRALTIALIGPTGVGKTTTLAKLAATFKLQHKRRVGLITCDTYRIAAVDQLRTYANIIGLPLEVALTPSEMNRAIHALSGCDVILIDTAGRGQNDGEKLDELQRFLDAATPHEIHLVLSGTASEKVLLREAEAFGQLGANRIVLTKLDEAVSFGMLLSVVRQVGKQLSFVTTGQEVPHHLEVGRPERLAELVLGGDVRA